MNDEQDADEMVDVEALEPLERHKLGAHYTPRAYVERLVMPTIINPVRADWEAVHTAATVLAGMELMYEPWNPRTASWTSAKLTTLLSSASAQDRMTTFTSSVGKLHIARTLYVVG